MSTLLALVRHEARNARLSLVVAPCVSTAALLAVQLFVGGEHGVAQARAACAGVFVVMWTLYLAADSFATDCGSGRMATRALLPVGALDLWRAKIAFLALAATALSAWTIACASVLQWNLGSGSTLAQFQEVLASMLPGIPFLVLLAAAAVLCSLVVDTAIVAMLLAWLSAATLFGLGLALARGLTWAGLRLSPAQWLVTASVGAILLFALGAVAFAHGQRHLGRRGARVRVVVGTLGVLVVTGGSALACELWWRVSGDLELSRARFEVASGSPDGRYLAVEVEADVRGNTMAPRAVWMLDLATGTSERVAWPAMLPRDSATGYPVPWDGPRELAVLQLRLSDWGTLDSVAKVAAQEEAWHVAPCGDAQVARTLLATDWAETTPERAADGTLALRVRWRSRGVERTFRSDERPRCLGSNLFLSAHAGRVLFVQDGSLRLADLDEPGERVLVESGVQSVWPSPDGSALLAWCKDATRAIATFDGTPLHAPWPRGSVAASWVEGEGSARVVELVEIGRGGRKFVKDLDTDVEFELPSDWTQNLLHRLADGGYVFVDDAGDLVRVDEHGARVAVLVDR